MGRVGSKLRQFPRSKDSEQLWESPGYVAKFVAFKGNSRVVKDVLFITPAAQGK